MSLALVSWTTRNSSQTRLRLRSGHGSFGKRQKPTDFWRRCASCKESAIFKADFARTVYGQSGHFLINSAFRARASSY
jgi:hypothetical protein